MSEYEDFVKTTDISNHSMQFYLDGMNEENGEISCVIKRIRLGDYGEEAKKYIDGSWDGINYVLLNFPRIAEDLIKEIGDRHWYTTRLLQELGSSWKEVEKVNLTKLEKRKAKGVIMGHGDKREDEV